MSRRFGDTQLVRGYDRPRDMDGAFTADYAGAFEAFDDGMFGDAGPVDGNDEQSQEVVIVPNRQSGGSPLFWLFGGLVLAKVFL